LQRSLWPNGLPGAFFVFLIAVQELNLMATPKPQVFIASSVEGLPVADAINANLDHDTYPTLWRTGTFKLGSNALDDLVEKSSAVDVAVFVFTPDDVATIRAEATQVVRDNVLFELGLFIGSLGKERCYVVRPRGVDMHLPSDLIGVTTADYATDRPDGDQASALNAACKLIKDEIARHGAISRELPPAVANNQRHVANPPNYELNRVDLSFLGECAVSRTSQPRGLSYQYVVSSFNHNAIALRLSAIKLARLGLVEQAVEEDRDGDVFYVYLITESGIDVLMKNEHHFQGNGSGGKPGGFEEMDDSVPF
jgi:hypothetical protein